MISRQFIKTYLCAGFRRQ